MCEKIANEARRHIPGAPLRVLRPNSAARVRVPVVVLASVGRAPASVIYAW